MSDHDPYCPAQGSPYDACICRRLAEARADECRREKVQRDMVEARADRLEKRLLGIYHNVEHLRLMVQREIDHARTTPEAFTAMDVGRLGALDDVLELFETEAYQKRVGSDGEA